MGSQRWRARITRARVTTAVAATVSAVVALGGLAAPAEAGTTSAEVWSAHGACIGGGDLSLTVTIPATGRISVAAVGAGLPNGAKWGPAYLSTGTEAFVYPPARTRHGGFTFAAQVARAPSPIYTFDVSGPHRRSCRMSLDPGGPYVVASRCRTGARISLRATASGKLHVVARLSRVRPKSDWSTSISVTTGSSGVGSGSQRTADRHGVVRASSSFGHTTWRRLNAGFASTGGTHCRLALVHHVSA